MSLGVPLDWYNETQGLLLTHRVQNVLGSLPPKVPLFSRVTLLTETGCNVAINYANSVDRANKFVKELETTYPMLKFAVIQADVGQKAACENLIEKTISELGGLDIVISNAGKLFFTQDSHCRVDAFLSI